MPDALVAAALLVALAVAVAVMHAEADSARSCRLGRTSTGAAGVSLEDGRSDRAVKPRGPRQASTLGSSR